MQGILYLKASRLRRYRTNVSKNPVTQVRIQASFIVKGEGVWFSSIQSVSRIRLFATPWTAARQASLSITNSRSLLKLMSYRASDAIHPSHPLSSPSPPAFNLSQHQGLFK